MQDAEIFEIEDPGRTGKERLSNASKSEDEAKSSGNEKAESRSRSVGKEENAGGKSKKELPCRISVKVAAVEAFVYNRSPVYDAILEQTLRKAKTPPSSSGKNAQPPPTHNSFSSESNNEKNGDAFGAPKRTTTNDTLGMSSIGRSPSHGKNQRPELPAFLRMLPVRIECKRAAATLGNENTKNVIVAKLEKAAGTIDAGHAGPLDLYKLLFSFDLEKINVVMRPNRDFKQMQLDAAQRILRERELESPPSQTIEVKFIRIARKRWHKMSDFFSRRKSVNGSLRTASMASEVQGVGAAIEDPSLGQTQWHGLSRYQDEKELNEHDEWRDIEYAKASTLADIEKLYMRFYFDIPGTVPDGIGDGETLLGSTYDDDMNGSKPPDYGLDFAVYGGVVTYGPWTDRQRINIQQIFMPASYVDAVPAIPLKPGETRTWSLFKIFVSVEEDVTLRLPTREPSKDDKWQGRAGKNRPDDNLDPSDVKRKHGKRHRHTRRRKGKKGNTGADARPYAWMDVTVKTDSTVNYVMDMFPRTTGYCNKLDLDVKSTEIASSVNHGLLWKTGAVSLGADLSQPASWSSVRRWPFEITIDDLELFILRDHFFLIIDLVNDWSAGPPVDFYTFVPYVYSLRMLFRNFIIYLDVNDANIINDPAELDKNDFLTLEGKLDSTLDINMDKYRPVLNDIAFDVLATDMRMRMLSPSRSTYNAFLKDKVVAELPKLTLSGSYCGHLEERPGLTDTLRFDIVGTGLTLKAYGFLVRQLINIKENYFGDYMHFKTLEEFQGADDDLNVANVKTASLPKPQSINELDVILVIIAEDVTIMLPTTMYSCEEFVRAELPVANLDLRILSYYLDMGLQLSPLTFYSGSAAIEDESPVDSASSTQLFVQHVDLDGHRAFGLPPNEPAYVDQWDIDIGAITGEWSSSFIHDLAMAGRAFVYGFADRENALPLSAPAVFSNVNFVQVRTDIVRIWFHVGKDALLLSTDPIEVGTNDLAGETFSQRVSVLVPKVTFACVDGRSASRHRSAAGLKTAVRTYAFFQTGVAVNVVQKKLHFEEERRKQQAHIRESDLRTGRAPFLQRHLDGAVPPSEPLPPFEPPAMPYPSLPLPLEKSGQESRRPSSIKSVQGFVSGKQIRAKSSSSSLASSLRNGGLAIHAKIKRLSRQDAKDTPSSQSMRSSSRASSASSRSNRRALPGDRERACFGQPPSTMAFSSPFSEPYFPLDMVEPDETNVPHFEFVSANDDNGSDRSSVSEAIDDPEMDHDVAQTSVFIRIVPGIRAYVEPRVAVTGAKLLNKILPATPAEVMDTFQMDVLGAVAGRQQERHGTNSTLELQIDLQSARLRVANPEPKKQAEDSLDINLHSVDTLVRVSKRPSASIKQNLAVRATVDNVDISLGLLHRPSSAKSPVQATIDDAMVWVAVAALKSVNVSVRETIMTVSGEQTQYLTDLVLRLLPLVDQIKSEISAPLETNRKRLMLLIYTLTQHSENVGDPIFLSRMTYILRAFPEHFRNQESWKIVVRFRHILHNLSRKVLDELRTNIKAPDSRYPSDVPAKALENWAQWHNWDVPNVNDTVAFQTLFREEGIKSTPVPEDKPMTLTVRSDYLRLAVEASGASNEIVIEETSLGLDSTPPTAPTGLMLVEENTRTKTLLQMHTTSIAFLINWTVFDIVENILPLTEKLQRLSSSKAGPGQPTASQRLEDRLIRHVFHLVASTDNGSISLQSINLRHVSRADGLKLSLIGTNQAGGQYGPCVSGIVNADEAVTELHGPSRCLWQTFLTSPSIYVDHVRPAPDVEMLPSVTIAVAYKSLRLAVLEQVPGLLHVVDSVILDEVAKILQLIQSTKPRNTSRPEEVSSPERSLEEISPATNSAAPVKVHVALLAGHLVLEVSLLQSLKYQLTGTAASIRVAPSLSQEKAWAIDFDMGRQNHRFVNSSANERQEQGILEIPPINGHVGIGMAHEATSVSITTTMERVEIDATVIQSVMGVLNRPEVQTVISAIEHGVEEVKDHVNDIKPANTVSENLEAPVGKHIAFDVRFALLGVRVAATTPRGHGSSMAEVEFGIGPVHIVASNRATFAESKSLVPEVRAEIREIGARLQILENGKSYPCGNAAFGLHFHFKSQIDGSGKLARELMVKSRGLQVNAYADTASTAVDVINHLQDRIKNLDLSKEMEYLRHLRDSRKGTVIPKISGKLVSEDKQDEVAFSAVDLLSVTTTVELSDIQIAWLVDQSYAPSTNGRIADLVATLDRIEFMSTGGHEARLTIQDTQVQLADNKTGVKKRALNSAILPEVSFSVAYWSKDKNRSFAFKAAGTPLEVRLESKFMSPVNALQRSINSAIEKFKRGTATWESTPTTTGAPRSALFDTKRLASLLIEADFAGARLYMEGAAPRDPSLSALAASSQQHGSQHGRYGQFAADGTAMQTTLTAPGIAMKIQYSANANERQPTVNGEVRIDASSNKLLPNVVPLILEVSNSVKEVIQNQDSASAVKEQPKVETKSTQRFFEDESIVTADPSAIFGKTNVNLGLRICRQEFGLTCQPIARVDAKAQLEDFYVTMNTIDSDEHGHFFAISAVVTKLSAQVKHMYSRESTFSYDMDSIVLSILNSKHLSGTSGISAILKINPTRTFINAKQLQDLLLFREIWLPPEIRASQSSPRSAQPAASRPDEFLVQKYQNVAAAAAFPWNATLSIAELAVDIDLGQSIGRSSFTINNLWASQTKSSNWEQNLCVGMEEMAMKSTGRMSGFISLGKLGVRMAIKWPQEAAGLHRTPIIQASLGFQRLRLKAAFDYQAFAFGDIEGFDFLMYNVHEAHGDRDRLVAVLDCEKAYVFCTATSPAQAVGLYQAFDRLIQEKQTAYVQSLKDIEKHLRRESTVVATRFGPQIPDSPVKQRWESKTSISLHTDVVLTIGAISVGMFPSTFFDSQILKLEANTIQTRFAVGLERGRIASGLGMTLGQLQVALASVRRLTAVPKALDVSVDDVVTSAVNSRGGTILRVPKVVASMQTWQKPDSNNVDYIFKSLFDGKIDVGWNLSRINFIKGMWETGSRSLASRLGKALPESAVKIAAGPTKEGEQGKEGTETADGQEKITAEVNLPQSRYEYHALERPIIETPQLRDMGEATPPLEWIGLHRDRLPNVTHQIVIVSLLEVAKEVEDAYERILGSS